MYHPFIDNRDGNTLDAALRGLVRDGRVAEDTELCIATCYFSPHAFSRLVGKLRNLPRIRILLGATPHPELNARIRPLGQAEAVWRQRILLDRKKEIKRLICKERDSLPFVLEENRSINALRQAIQQGRLQLRRYEEDFLHAKTYLLRRSVATERNLLITGSSNLTPSGLSQNLEANLGSDHPATTEQAGRWFDDLWETATPFDLASLLGELLELQPPWLVYLRTLFELYGEELESAKEEEREELTNFQLHGVARSLRLIQQNGGALVADEVGLGKTYIAGEIIKRYAANGQRSLVICPAALRDTIWKRFLSDEQLFCEILSYQQLERSPQLFDSKGPDADSVKMPSEDSLSRKKAEYRLIVIDEAHNYRNPQSPMRAGILRALLAGERKHLLMLTATPVNNSLWDLHTLLSYFLNDGHFAHKGIPSLYSHFAEAMRVEAADLNPDSLFTVVDATTVKRTRKFIRRYYQNDYIRDINNIPQQIKFPKPQLVTVQYNLEAAASGLLDQIERTLNPDNAEAPQAGELAFARYRSEEYLIDKGQAAMNNWVAITALLRSAMLKRFESSFFAFSRTLQRMIRDHRICLEALGKNKVIGTSFLRELDADDEGALEELLEDSLLANPAECYESERWRQDLEQDLAILEELHGQVGGIQKEQDPKLAALADELEQILAQAERDGNDSETQGDYRKVLIFSFFADTVEWIKEYLDQACAKRPKLAPYRGRIAFLTGSHSKSGTRPSMGDHKSIPRGFAPKTMGQADDEDRFDILISTDVLAEGVNLQQCRHIINYDLPWNPMRLVQRHGRIDRINSTHPRVWLRTIFPNVQLDRLLGLEERIIRKLNWAARSVGVQHTVSDAPTANRSFSDDKAEIYRLQEGKSDIFENGGTQAATQSGEEYRQQLRLALQENPDPIHNYPFKAGSCLHHPKAHGFFFCARIEKQVMLRFVPSRPNWIPNPPELLREDAHCLRIIECSEETPLAELNFPEKAPYDFWKHAKDDMLSEWNKLSDPINLQPPITALNNKVSQFIRNHCPKEIDNARQEKAINLIETPWPRRQGNKLRAIYNNLNLTIIERVSQLIDCAIEYGIPSPPSQPVEPAEPDQVRLICWMAVSPL